MNIKKLNEEIKLILEDEKFRDAWSDKNNTEYEEYLVDSKEVELIPGALLKFNRVALKINGEPSKYYWELDSNESNMHNFNRAIRERIVSELNIPNYDINQSFGPIPIKIQEK